LLLVKTGSGDSVELTAEDVNEAKELASRASLAQIIRAVKLFGQLDLSLDNYSTLPLELALVDATVSASEEKEESVPQAEPEPVAKKSAPRSAPPASKKPETPEDQEQPAPQPETVKEPEPEPEVSGPVDVEKPVPPPEESVEEPTPPVAEKTGTGNLATDGTIEQLQSQWSKIINEAPDGMGKTPTAALLRSAMPKAIENDTIVVSFKYAYHKEKMDNLDNQKIADKIVSSFLGRSCRVRCVYEYEKNHLVKEALKMGAQHDNGEVT